jgi:hypothetical protein
VEASTYGLMSPLLEAAGVPPIAAHALGVGAGLGWNKLGVPAINAGGTAAQTADRMAQAKALTGPPNQALADALMRRAATRPTRVGPNTSAAMNAARAAARGPSLLANPPGNGPH